MRGLPLRLRCSPRSWVSWRCGDLMCALCAQSSTSTTPRPPFIAEIFAPLPQTFPRHPRRTGRHQRRIQPLARRAHHPTRSHTHRPTHHPTHHPLTPRFTHHRSTGPLPPTRRPNPSPLRTRAARRAAVFARPPPRSVLPARRPSPHPGRQQPRV